jgi:hypothetical protein
MVQVRARETPTSGAIKSGPGNANEGPPLISTSIHRDAGETWFVLDCFNSFRAASTRHCRIQQTRLKAEYDTGDHLHPNDAGERAVSEAIDLSKFR